MVLGLCGWKVKSLIQTTPHVPFWRCIASCLHWKLLVPLIFSISLFKLLGFDSSVQFVPQQRLLLPSLSLVTYESVLSYDLFLYWYTEHQFLEEKRLFRCHRRKLLRDLAVGEFSGFYKQVFYYFYFYCKITLCFFYKTSQASNANKVTQ